MNHAESLRRLLEGPQALVTPTVYDALSARIAAQAGFAGVFVSGFGIAASRLGMPDTGLISFGEMLEQIRGICGAVPDIPVIADADTGFGNAMNVRRTIFEYARAGASCVMIEDQVSPKRCGHFEGKQVIPREEARTKIRAAVEAAREVGILVLARTDARAPEGFDAALQRCQDFEREGADIVFLEAPQSEDELNRFVRSVTRPTMANMVAGGRTPMLTPQALSAMGVRLAVYHPLLFSAVKAMQDAAAALIRGDPDSGPPACSINDVKQVVDMPGYEALERRYAVPIR
jgi:2-methylisocitrate lyase-like PEP mutase family enzyme